MKKLSENLYLADLLFPNIPTGSHTAIVESYHKRKLDQDAMVTRFAPSPTGFLHIGGLFTAMINKRFANQTGGTFFLRIDDTDKKREVKGGISKIIRSLNSFDIKPDEGVISQTRQVGQFGPYIQSQRLNIYHSFVKKMIQDGLAYPCFCTTQDLTDIRARQEMRGVKPGYYGDWAKHRKCDVDVIEGMIKTGNSFVIRLLSHNGTSADITYKDDIRGMLTFPQNNNDAVIIKSDGYPTYHFAHVIDDHLMQTTHVIRSDEWLSSMPLHLQLFQCFGWEPPHFAHISPIMKNDGGSKRKLSKRKDPEADMAYYTNKGYIKEAVGEYLMNIANSNYEDWRKSQKKPADTNFRIRFDKINKSGALFDIEKLNSIGKDEISKLTPKELESRVIQWLKLQNSHTSLLILRNTSLLKKILSIGKDDINKRKDFSCFEEMHILFDIFYDDLFNKIDQSKVYNQNGKIEPEAAVDIISSFISTFSIKDSRDTWLKKVKNICNKQGYAEDAKTYDSNKHLGHLGDVLMIIRTALTKKTATPDLYEIIGVLGHKACINRLRTALLFLENTPEIQKGMSSSISIIQSETHKLSALFGDYKTTSKAYVKDVLQPQVDSIYGTVENGFCISTCLRSEIYQISEAKISSSADFFYGYGEPLAIRLISVLTGMQSEIVGEREIFGQFRDSINKAHENKKLDSRSFEYMHQLLEISQKIRSEFKITNQENYSTIGANVIKAHIEKLSNNPSIMIIGGGYMTESFVKTIKDNGYRVIWANRSIDKIKQMSTFFSQNKDRVFFCNLEDAKKFLPLVDAVFVAINNRPNYFTEEDTMLLSENCMVVDVSYPEVFVDTGKRKILTIQNTDFGKLSSGNIEKKLLSEIQQRIISLVRLHD